MTSYILFCDANYLVVQPLWWELQKFPNSRTWSAIDILRTDNEELHSMDRLQCGIIYFLSCPTCLSLSKSEQKLNLYSGICRQAFDINTVYKSSDLAGHSPTRSDPTDNRIGVRYQSAIYTSLKL